MRRPLRRFALLGVLLFATDLLAGTAVAPRTPAVPAGASDEELLFQEALARGWHRTDPVVRRRLARNLRFALSLPEAPEEEDARVEEAIALGMHRSDLVVRRRLVQKMQLLAQEAARLSEPTGAELAAYLAAHAEAYRQPPRVTLTQVFFRRRADAEAAARRAARAPDRSDPLAALEGDPFPLPRRLPSHAERELAARLGPALARAAIALPAGAVAGPLRSAYGWHVVHVRARREARVPPLAAVRARVRDALLAERAAARLEAMVARLRGRSGAS